MPWGDGTGPAGMGPMTGRAAGYCAGYPVPGYMNPMPGFGYGAWGGAQGGYWRRPGYGYATAPYAPMGYGAYGGFPYSPGFAPRFGGWFGRGRGMGIGRGRGRGRW
jgi:hypothetical protein